MLMFLASCTVYDDPSSTPYQSCGDEPADQNCDAYTTCCTVDDCWFESGGKTYTCATSSNCDAAIDDLIDDTCDFGSYDGGGGGGGGTIFCDDGTRSPSCTTCSQGCCSGHGGC